MSSPTSSLPFLPSTLPLLPLPPPHLLYPFLQISIPISPSHLALVLQSIAENARSQKLDGTAGFERILGVVPVVEIERRVGRWATAARIKRITRSKDSPCYTLTLEGIARIRLPRSLPPVLSILPPIPLYTSTFALPLPVLHSPSAPDLLSMAIPLLPQQLQEKLGILPASLLCDLLVTVLGVEWEVRVETLGLVDVDERCERVRRVLEDMLVKKGIPLPPSPSTSSPPSKRPDSKALVPYRPLSVTTRPPSSSSALKPPGNRSSPNAPPDLAQVPEDLQPLVALLTRRTSELTGAAYHTIHREVLRLSKIPNQSAEYGVTKTYLELLLALPWKRVSSDANIGLEQARQKLEEEHEGLLEVKRRVVEYLAVYRLKKQLFAEEQAKLRQSSQPQPPASATNLHGGEVSHAIDPATASELLGLIPNEQRKEIEAPLPPAIEDGPPTGVYRDKGPILLLVGPPGVGKTSIARSLADSMGRKFQRISLGGVRDEAEIRGHRRTYVGALPGLLVQALRKVGVSNPVILLDEMDKLSSSSVHGDPSAALLETLDPAQNWGFHDHYLGGEVPLDLSQVMFIGTANTLETISPPLLDRCEVIECSGYVMEEKVRIAERFLVKKQVEENGLTAGLVRVGDEVLRKVIEDYTRESGVRTLERQIGKLVRSKAVDYSQSLDSASRYALPTASTSLSAALPASVEVSSAITYEPEITLSDVERILGLPKFEPEVREVVTKPGVVHGLSYKGSGMGGVLVLEAVTVPGTGKLHCTGRLGEVIQESAELALTWVKSNAGSLGIPADEAGHIMKGIDVHLHLPAGAIKKDGPSAGIAMVVAFVSLFAGKAVPPTTAFTGEITLRGAITPVGGIKEKILGAHRAGITRIIMSSRNSKDVQADVPDSIRSQIEFRFVKTIEEALVEVWGEGAVAFKANRSEARL